MTAPLLALVFQGSSTQASARFVLPPAVQTRGQMRSQSLEADYWLASLASNLSAICLPLFALVKP